MRIRTMSLAVALALFAGAAADADESSWDWAGNVEMQSRFFADNALWPGQTSQTAQVSLSATAELRWRGDDHHLYARPAGLVFSPQRRKEFTRKLGVLCVLAVK